MLKWNSRKYHHPNKINCISDWWMRFLGIIFHLPLFLGRWLTIGHTRKTIYAQKCDNVFMQLNLFCIKHTFEWSVPRIQHKTDCLSSSCTLLQNDAKDLTIYMYIWSPECTCRSFRRCPSNRYTELAVGISSLEVQLFLFVVPRM